MAEKKSGRKAQTRGVSLSPREVELVDAFARLTGLGLTEQVRQSVIARLPAAVALAQDMQEAGMDIAAPFMAERVVYAESDADRRALYADGFEPEEARQPAGAGGR
jgi:hypothetical protein